MASTTRQPVRCSPEALPLHGGRARGRHLDVAGPASLPGQADAIIVHRHGEHHGCAALLVGAWLQGLPLWRSLCRQLCAVAACCRCVPLYPTACRHDMGAVGHPAKFCGNPLQRPVRRHCSLWHSCRLQMIKSCEASCCMFWGAHFADCLLCAAVLFLAASERLQA